MRLKRLVLHQLELSNSIGQVVPVKIIDAENTDVEQSLSIHYCFARGSQENAEIRAGLFSGVIGDSVLSYRTAICRRRPRVR